MTTPANTFYMAINDALVRMKVVFVGGVSSVTVLYPDNFYPSETSYPVDGA